MKISDHNQKVLEKFATMMVTRMESMKVSQWKQGWLDANFSHGPVNIEGRSYNGFNRFFLLMHTSKMNFMYPIYATLKQLNRLGCHVNKGAKSMPIMFYERNIKDASGNEIEPNEFFAMSADDQSAYHVQRILKSYNVFNIAQTNFADKQEDKYKQLLSEFDDRSIPANDQFMYVNESLDAMLHTQSWLCPIFVSKTKGASYDPDGDKITVPVKSRFSLGASDDDLYCAGMEYYATLIHEMIHSTGSPERLNRMKGDRFGDALYAKEELIAELGAALIGQELGFRKRILDRNAAYLNGWISSLKKNPKYILSLMSDVDKASRMILEKLAA